VLTTASDSKHEISKAMNCNLESSYNLLVLNEDEDFINDSNISKCSNSSNSYTSKDSSNDLDAGSNDSAKLSNYSDYVDYNSSTDSEAAT
jgi:hypothetical protein